MSRNNETNNIFHNPDIDLDTANIKYPQADENSAELQFVGGEDFNHETPVGNQGTAELLFEGGADAKKIEVTQLGAGEKLMVNIKFISAVGKAALDNFGEKQDAIFSADDKGGLVINSLTSGEELFRGSPDKVNDEEDDVAA